MLGTIIVLLFTLAAILAALTIADSAIKAREAYAQLLHEAALMQAGFAVKVAPQAVLVRRKPVLAPVRAPGRAAQATAMRERRAQPLRLLPACVAA